MKLKNFEKFVNENYEKEDGFEDIEKLDNEDEFSGEEDEFCADDLKDFLRELDVETLASIASGECDLVALASEILEEGEDEDGDFDDSKMEDEFQEEKGEEEFKEDEMYAESKKPKFLVKSKIK